ncbi:MAG: glutathione S-transferase, partial [Rhodospirillaceae bacterium]|nr:glutathione S-transferase [Rhodospirillaceae bacterium]
MYKLYWSAGSAAMAPQAIVLESGARAEFIHLDDEKREHKSADYLKLN